jgi:hypothetical protein
MNHIDIIDEHLIIRETVGYEVLNQVPIEDMPKVMEFLKIVYNYNRMKRVAKEDKESGWVDPMEELFDWEEAAQNYKKKVMKDIREEENRDLIKKILADRSNANGHDEYGNPKYIYDGYEYILNTSCNKILSMSFERKFKLDDSFKKALEEAPSWMDEYREEYDKLLKSGMFFEFHPTWTGEWEKDRYTFCHGQKFKKK